MFVPLMKHLKINGTLLICFYPCYDASYIYISRDMAIFMWMTIKLITLSPAHRRGVILAFAHRLNQYVGLAKCYLVVMTKWGFLWLTFTNCGCLSFTLLNYALE